MDQVLWKKCTFFKARKEEINEVKNGRAFLASEEKTLWYEKYQTWWGNYLTE